MDYYNGYSPLERERKLRALHKRFPGRSHPYYSGPCHMCGDPDSPVAPHSEDYSDNPYQWLRPAVYALCRGCHGRLHKRFTSPHSWEAYKHHLRRGGYGSDLRRPPLAREVARLAKLISMGSPQPLQPLREPKRLDAWWEGLTMDPRSLAAGWARKR